ncbi:hypothetical protein DPMN_105877 [Dreissena polymorpha]|uniref:Uncharacterized protein n=1 Tax=Dreissena polymorpha TaxID=45954 RepID=A0A9D4K3Z0_DREPO|nr:hypothetical protein DPMN_105877 [Dreissena polymorpha]
MWFAVEKRCYRNDSDPDSVFTLVLRQTFSAVSPLAKQIVALDPTTKAPSSCKGDFLEGIIEMIIKYNIDPIVAVIVGDCQSAVTFQVW